MFRLCFSSSAAIYPKGVEVALCSLRIGSRVFLRVRGSTQGYSESRRPEGVKADDVLFFDLRVCRQEKEKNLHQMETHEKIAFATQSHSRPHSTRPAALTLSAVMKS